MSLPLLLLFLLANGSCLFSSLDAAFSGTPPSTMRFELFKSNIQGAKELLHDDNRRTEMISQRVGQRRKSLETSAIIDISSGAYWGTGQYFVELRVGTPSQKFRLVADTGSDLTWMNCRYKCGLNCPKRVSHRRVFHSYRSSSFRPIPCSAQMCVNLPFSLAGCPTPNTPCEYDYRYADGSTSHGIFANETVSVGLTNGRKMKLHHVVVGCSSALTGSSFLASDGVLGLGYTNYSFVTKSIHKFGGKFSYCLVDHLSPKNVTSYLTFGGSTSTSMISSTNMRYTPLPLNVLNGFYPVNVMGMSVNGVMLDIPMATWDVTRQGGVIIDSGTSLTFLAKPAYGMVIPALKLVLMGMTKEVQLKPFDYCFSSIGFNEALAPKLVIHFAHSVRFEPPVKSYVIDVSDGVKCLGFMPNGWPDVSIIGNIMQQNFLWEFDIARQRLGFAPSTCVTG